MNKTLLIIICDFLLISILAMVEFTPPEEETSPDPQVMEEDGNREMVELLRLSLENEADLRENLENDLSNRESELSTTIDQLEETSDSLMSEQQRNADLSEKAANLESMVSSRTEALEQLNEEHSAVTDSLKKETAQSKQLQAELQSKLMELEATQSAMNEATEAIDSLKARENILNTELKIKETETRLLEQNLIAAKADIEKAQFEAELAERRASKLAENVGELAATSTELKAAIDQSKELSLNAIFRKFENNRIPLTFNYREKLLIGSVDTEKSIEAVTVEIGGKTYALFSVNDTPLEGNRLERYQNLEFSVEISGKIFVVQRYAYLNGDNRIASIPIPAQIINESELDPFELDKDPLRFGEAVLVANKEGLFGEIPIRVLPNNSDYLEVETKLFSRLFGEFSPSMGDYVFSKTGKLMAIMVSNDRARLIQNPSFTELQTLN